MLKTNTNQKGFTIIEVLIVLAVAGLMMLVVFMAVPALQRNSRNEGYRTDASAILGAVSEFSNANNGRIPTPADRPTIQANAKIKDIVNLQIVTGSSGASSPTLDTAYIRTSSKCPATVPAVGATNITPQSGATRQVVLLYAIEAGGGIQLQCQESGV